ncbi:hypothetical protein BurJ1DRAFT_2143 [Burkholderiales bacterium JOSHI_001]|nr:hypothetical protein BurJ1DRAFT_2143 [Burkholderiales bacterium JOSHI_001]
MRLVLSWLLVAVLAVDLVTSPLHAHRHDGKWSLGGTLSAAADHPSDLRGLDPAGALALIDDHEAPGVSHSISALRSAAEVIAGEPASDDPPAAATWLTPAPWSPGPAPAVAWPPDQHRAGSSAFKGLPPHGRAPPLHV